MTREAERNTHSSISLGQVTMDGVGQVCATDIGCEKAQRTSSSGNDAAVTDLRTMGTAARSEPQGNVPHGMQRSKPKGCSKKNYYYWNVGATRRAQDTIGTSYPLKGEKAWMNFRTGSSDTYKVEVGVAAKYKGTGGNWKEVESATKSRGFGFQWAKSKKFRSYRVFVQYERLDRYYKCTYDNWSWWRPRGLVGTTNDHVRRGGRPKWKNCYLQPSKGVWQRYASNGKSYQSSIGVKFEGAIGFDMATTRAYNREAILNYTISKKRKRILCGNNGVPAKAGKIMMKSR